MKQYGVILCDPPWNYNVSHRRGAAAKYYQTMKLPELVALPVADLAADDCVLLMWATWPKLGEAALPLISAWGFQYVTGFPWVKLNAPPRPRLIGDMSVKPAWGTGYWIRGATEPLLIARRGKPSLPDNPPIGILCKRMEHSRKPDSVYEYGEMFPGPRIELFARRRRPGWDAWGNEVESTTMVT